MKTSQMTTLQILRRGLRRVRKGWTKGAYVRGASGQPIGRGTSTLDEDCDSYRAAKWCALGAVNADPRAAFVLESVLGIGHVPGWNDAPGRTQSEVIDLFKRAIKREEGKS